MQLTYESLAAVSSLTARVDTADWKSYMQQVRDARDAGKAHAPRAKNRRHAR